jgi:hypothetical protein
MPSKIKKFCLLHKFSLSLQPKMKPNKPYLRIFNTLLILAAYGYLAYRLIIFDDYSSFFSAFQSMHIWQWLSLIAILLLMPINVLAEAGKWRLLLRKTEPMTIWGAQRQVYYGYVGAFITPYHAGDYPARAMLLKDKANFSAAIAMGLVGTVALLVVELIFGIPATWLFVSYDHSLPMQYFAVAFIVLVLLLSFLPHLVRYLSRRPWNNTQMQQLSVALSHMSYPLFMKTIAWSMLRYSIWAIQLALTLHFCGVDMTFVQYLIAIPFYYMVITIFPSMPLLNLAIRGSWSLIIFGVFTPNTAGIALAVALIWLINTVLPMLIGSILYKNGKTK